MVIQRCKKIDRTSGPILKASKLIRVESRDLFCFDRPDREFFVACR